MKNIPKNLFTYLVDRGDCLNVIESEEFIQSITGKPVIIVDFIDYRYSGRKRYTYKLKWYQDIKLKRSYKYFYHSYIENEKKNLSDSFVGFNLPNSSFKLRLNTSFSASKYYGSYVILELVNEYFDDLLYQPAIYLDTEKFIKLLNSCKGCLENGMIPGNYKIEIVSLSHYSDYNLINEDDPKIEDAISILVGESILNKKTRNLLPGHFYCFDNREVFLCLGEINDINGYSRKYYNKEPVSIFINSFLSSISLSYIENGYLIVPISYLDISILYQIINLVNKKIDKYELIKYVLDISISNWNSYWCGKLLSIIDKNNCLAIDLNISVDIIGDYSIDLKCLLKNCILETINNMNEHEDGGNRDCKTQSFISLFSFISDIVGDDVDLRKRFINCIVELCGSELREVKRNFKDKNSFNDFILNYDGSNFSYKGTTLSFYDKHFAKIIKSLITGIPEYGLIKITKEELNYIIDKIYAS